MTKPQSQEYLGCKENMAKIIVLALEVSEEFLLRKRFLKRVHSLFLEEMEFYQVCLTKFNYSKSSRDCFSISV